MIDIQPHLDKLDRLKEYMDASIDNEIKSVWIDMDALEEKPMSIKEIMKWFDSTGVMFYTPNRNEPIVKRITFEEYLQLNN